MKRFGLLGLMVLAVCGAATAAPVVIGTSTQLHSPAASVRAPVASKTITVKPITSTASSRALDPSRRKLLDRAGLAGNPKGLVVLLKREDYIKFMRGQFRTKDWNQNGLVSWQGPNAPENLGSQAECVIVDYEHVAAKSEKDKANPGKFISTPEQWKPVDWVTFLEVLGATKFEGGQCLAIAIKDVPSCLIGGKAVPLTTLYPPGGGCTMMPGGLCVKVPFAGLNHALHCFANPTDPSCDVSDKKLCADKGGTPITMSKMEGCEQWEQFGPDSEEAFIKVAALNFDAEDWNKDGVMNNGEGKFLCNKK